MSVPPAALQDRSRRTRQTLLDAGLHLLAEQGPEALTISAVSAAAGVAVGTVYRRFGDKEGLLAAVQQQFTAEFRDEFAQRMHRRSLPAEASPADAVDVAVRALSDTFEAHAPLLRVFAVLGLGDEQVLATGSRASQDGGRLFRDLLWPYRSAFNRADASFAIDIAYRLLYAGFMHRVLHGPHLESATDLSWNTLAAELSRTATLQLLGRGPVD